MPDENGIAPSQPPFPHTQVQVLPQGIVISTVFGPGIVFSTTLDENTANNIMKLWVQTRKDIADQMRVIEHVRQSKIN
jgi:hypothetical protein